MRCLLKIKDKSLSFSALMSFKSLTDVVMPFLCSKRKYDLHFTLCLQTNFQKSTGFHRTQCKWMGIQKIWTGGPYLCVRFPSNVTKKQNLTRFYNTRVISICFCVDVCLCWASGEENRSVTGGGPQVTISTCMTGLISHTVRAAKYLQVFASVWA